MKEGVKKSTIVTSSTTNQSMRDSFFGTGISGGFFKKKNRKNALRQELKVRGQQSISDIQRQISPQNSTVNPENYTIEDFIKIVKKIEQNKPDWTPRQVLESLHVVAGTNNDSHRRMMQTKQGNALSEDILPKEEIDKLEKMLSHSNPDSQSEFGTVKDNSGQNLALAHVLTGIGAGLKRRNISPSELKDGFWPSTGDLLTIGSNIDNLYAETLAGDLGQSAVLFNAGIQDKLIGAETEATDAELIGDIDGFLLGQGLSLSAESRGKFEKGELKLSAILESYYKGMHTERFKNISKIKKEDLQEETENFADNYAYLKHGTADGFFTEVGSEAGEAAAQFWTWVEKKQQPPQPVKQGNFGGTPIFPNTNDGIWLPSDRLGPDWKFIPTPISDYSKQNTSESPESSTFIKEGGTVSKTSWGETSGIYPGTGNLYKPNLWDKSKTQQLLKARAAVHEVGKRGEKVHAAFPGNDAISVILKPYHFIENFPVADKEISDAGVKWFYLSSKADGPIKHPALVQDNYIVKTYGPFYNIGGGDVPKGTVYIHFYKLK